MQIFSDFWALGNYSAQNAYLFGCIKQNAIKRKTKKRDTRRTCTITYTVKCLENSFTICKKAFISIHAIGRGRTEFLIKKLKNGQVGPKIDQRGKHDKHKKKYSTEDIETVKQFIEMCPKYESHYSRRNNYNKTYMSMEYNIANLYDEYARKCNQEEKSFVSADKFRRIFTEEFNISFKGPKSDTCATCDELNIKINEAKRSKQVEDLQKITLDKELHLRKADAAFNCLKSAKAEAQQNQNVHVITFDLQQALPTPKLTTGLCFYKKKLWCYNISIHCCNEPEQGYFFMWNESVAKRGSDEITSCLFKYFKHFDISGDILYAVSDNCCGQNKNWTMMGFWQYLIAIKRFKKIVHIFPQVGHTMLPSDRDFGQVEKEARRHEAIYSPTDWENILKSAQKKQPFKVTLMTNKDFFEFTELKGFFKQNQETGIASLVRIEFRADFPLTLYGYESYSGLAKEISLRKRGKLNLDEIKNFEPKQKYKEPLAIEESKLNHVMSCIQWIPPIHHAFYYSLKSDKHQ